MGSNEASDAGQEQRVVDRFDHHVLHTRGQRFEPAFGVWATGDNHHGYRARLGIAVQPATQISCAAIGECHGRYDEIRGMSQCSNTGFIRG